MGKPETCMRCGSTDIIPTARFTPAAPAATGAVNVAVDAKPGAFVTQGTKYETLQACVCAACGHVEAFVEETARLKAAYEESVRRTGTP